MLLKKRKKTKMRNSRLKYFNKKFPKSFICVVYLRIRYRRRSVLKNVILVNGYNGAACNL